MKMMCVSVILFIFKPYCDSIILWIFLGKICFNKLLLEEIIEEGKADACTKYMNQM